MLTRWASLARKLPSPLYKLLAQGYIDREFPRHIFVETTASCNLSCSYCPREKNNEHMSWELFKEIVNEVSRYGCRSFSLHLFGEPLLYPRILDAIRYIKEKNKKHTILLTTNGTLLNKFTREIVALGVDRVIWSWRRNNFSDETIRMLRSIGLVRLLIEETPKEEFEKWSKFPRVEVKHLHNYGGNIDTTKWGLRPNDEILSRYPCYHLWLAPAIRWNGEFTICCNDPRGSEVFGSVARSSIASLWVSDTLRKIRESHINGEYKGLCVGCNSYKAYPDMFFNFQRKNGHPDTVSV